MMYSTPGQPLPGTGVPYGGPPQGGRYAAPSGGTQPGYPSSHPPPPTHQMAGMSIGQGLPGRPISQPPLSGQYPQQNSGPPPPSFYGPPPSTVLGQGPANFGQGPSAPPTGGIVPPPHSTPQQNFHPPPSTSNTPQTGFGQVFAPGQTGFGPPPISSSGGPPTSGQAPPMGPGQHSGQAPPTSGQPRYFPPPPNSQPSIQSGQPSGQHLRQPPANSGQPPPMGYGPPPISGQGVGQPPLTSGQAPPMGYGAPLISSGQGQQLGYGSQIPGQSLGQPPPPMSSGAPPISGHQPVGAGPSGHHLGQPLPPSGHLPPGGAPPLPPSGQPTSVGYAPPQMFGHPSGQADPTSGQVSYSHAHSGQGGPSLGPPPPPPPGSGHGIPGHHLPGPPQMMQPPPGVGMHSAVPPQPGVPPPGPGGMPPRGPGMMPPPGSPGGPMGAPMAPTGGLAQQLRTRIDPDQMPNPVAMMKLDQDQRGSIPFHTSARGIPPPLVTTNFTVIDDGNSSPRYLRATMYTVPCSRDLLNNCRIPLGLVVQPLATIPDRENTLHLVDHGTGGPLRCNRCKTYMNPFVRFVDGGRQYICPICQCSNEVPQEYFCHLDHKGMRTDIASRPELTFGSVEYKATVDYCKDSRLPKPPAYIFMIDVSAGSVNTGLLSLLSQSILSVLDHLPDANHEGGSPILVGLATYDRVLHFYNLNPTLAQPGMMVVTDTADVFVPMVDGFLVNAKEARAVMESLLSQLPEMFSGARPSEVVLEPAVRAGLEALKAAQRNGRLFVFHSGLPTAQGPGQLKNRLDSKLLGTDKEKVLFTPVNSPYTKLAEECVKHGVAVEMFLTPTTYCDVATLGGLCNTTGGQLHLFHDYKTITDGSRLLSELTHCVARHTGFDAVMRVRASTGLRPTGFYGAFLMQNTTDIELGNVDADKAIAVELKHDDKLKEEEIAFFQAALLYTTYQGERRLRIHNLALNCTTKFQDLYRSCEIDAVVNYFSKSLLHASLSLPYKTIRESFTKQCATILACYRKQCSSQSPAGQLILPESLKLLPMYANCILKSDCLLSPPILSMDEKCWLMYSVLSMPLEQSGVFFYPRMISLHDVDVEEKGLPPIQRCTGQKLQDTGVYIVENGFQLVMWVGQQVSHDFISHVFGAPSPAQINTDLPSLPALDNRLSFRVRGICSQLQETRQFQMKVKVVKQRDKSEVFFRRMLKEDKGAGQWEGTSYIDYLCQIHRDIKEILN